MWTIAKPGRARITERRSRFLAFAYPVENEGDAESQVGESKKRYRDARHVVYAYRIFEGGALRERADDAGEPSRSAGWAILELLRGRDLVNVLVVVARYFGGVKLGVGNLRRAYRDAAVLALEDAGIAEFVPRVRLHIVFAPDHTGRAFSALERCGGVTIAQGFQSGKVVITAEVPADQLERLYEDLQRWCEFERAE